MKALLLVLLAFSCSKQEKDNRSGPVVPDVAVSPAPSVSPEDGVLDSSGPYAVIKTKKRSYHTGLLKDDSKANKEGRTYAVLGDCDGLPDAFDLRSLGVVSDVRDQGSCGSCWSFSKTGSLESALRVAGKGAYDLSEQELVSCDKSQYGCNGGLLTDFKYQIDKGQSLESDFPYTARDSRCKAALKPAAKGMDFQYIGSSDRSPTEAELKCALYKFHTVPWITVSASGAWGSPPESEKTPYSHCGHGQTNHAVGVVGWWKDSKGKTQFIMKNSWGSDWGAGGYMSLPLGCDSFGDEVAFIQVEKPEPSPSPSPSVSPSPSPSVSPTPSPEDCKKLYEELKMCIKTNKLSLDAILKGN